MATSTSNPLRAVGSVNPYSSKVVKIAVGLPKTKFSIHKAKLERLTSFFNIHGDPLNTPTRTNSAPPSEADSDGVIVPLSVDGDVSMKVEDGWQVAKGRGDESDETADYTIADRFHTPGAFKVLADWVYSEPPKMPRSRIECKNLLQAYVLARQYNAYDLQNLILDRFREHHSSYNLDLDNMVWLANRIGDSIEDCAIAAYFVEQAAFEIMDRGYDEFEAGNLFFKTFLAEGDWTIRLELFKALARHARASGGQLGDPAKSLTENWHVEVTGEDAGKIKAGVKRGIASRTRRANVPGI